jgi:hypothetical protein
VQATLFVPLMFVGGFFSHGGVFRLHRFSCQSSSSHWREGGKPAFDPHEEKRIDPQPVYNLGVKEDTYLSPSDISSQVSHLIEPGHLGRQFSGLYPRDTGFRNG